MELNNISAAIPPAPSLKEAHMTASSTYVLDDQSSFYNGRKVVKVRELGGANLACVVRVCGTKIEFVTTQWRLAAS